MTSNLDALRKQLDAIDQQLVALLSERRSVVADVARIKLDAGAPFVRDASREQAIVDRARRLAEENGLDPDHVASLFRAILEQSVKLQREYLAAKGLDPASGRYDVGYQGGEGAYSHAAAMRHFAGRGEPACVGYPSFGAMLDALVGGDLRYAVLPVENSIAGSIHESYDLLARLEVHIVGEEIQPVAHCLIGLENIPVGRIRRVISHPVALSQCRKFLASLENCHVESYVDTALAVKKVAEDQDPSLAAIASEAAARLYGLPVIAREIADDPENYTRMLIVAREPATVKPGVAAKTSVVFTLSHKPGALAEVIALLARHSLNLTKIESRPVPGRPFEYLFYVDFEGNTEDAHVAAALVELRARTTMARVLGCYPRAGAVSSEA